jgi:hypothetical protein
MGCKQDILCGRRTIIGIRDYADCTKPESGLFLNDIPGIKLKNLAAIADAEHQSGYELAKQIIRNATMFVFEDFNNKVSGSFKYNAVAEIRKINFFDGSILPAAPLERGLVLKRWRSEMAQIYVSEVFVKSQNSGVATIKIIDGNVTKEYEVDLVANVEAKVLVDYQATSEQIKIVCNDTDFAMYSGQINKSFAGCMACGGTPDQGFYITGWDGMKEVLKYYGIGVNASVRCNEENLICLLLKKMNFIFWYKAGAMYYEELKGSTRLNPITMFSKDKLQENLDDLNEKYEKAFASFVPSINAMIKSTKGECYTCNPQIKYVQTVP